MTKNVRIENADTSSYKVSVEVWEDREGVDTLIETRPLEYPTEMITLPIWKNRYLVIKETA